MLAAENSRLLRDQSHLGWLFEGEDVKLSDVLIICARPVSPGFDGVSTCLFSPRRQVVLLDLIILLYRTKAL